MSFASDLNTASVNGKSRPGAAFDEAITRLLRKGAGAPAGEPNAEGPPREEPVEAAPPEEAPGYEAPVFNHTESAADTEETPEAEDPDSAVDDGSCQYFTDSQGRLAMWEEGRGKKARAVPLACFDARIVEETLFSSGRTHRLEFKIVATRPSSTGVERSEITVEADKFDSMGWVTAQLGAAWALAAGRGIKEHARAAIQRLSAATVRRRRCYEHTGWERVNGRDYYLHAGGAIGADGPADGFQVRLPRLERYVLPDPVEGEELTRSIKACLRIFSLAQDDRPSSKVIAATVAALPWRSVLRVCNYAVSFVGGTGSRKTSAACLAIQHFAPRHTHDAPPPETWDSTGARMEYLLHAAKDTVLLLDNFIADGTKGEASQSKAATVFNNQGDGKGRGRMNADNTPREDFPPRGSVLSTGEDSVQRKSAKGRALTVIFSPGSDGEPASIDLDALTLLQADAAEGLYARAMASYIKFVAGDRDAWLAKFEKTLAAKKQLAMTAVSGGHSRTPHIIADLSAGFALFLEWAAGVGAISSELRDKIAARHWEWLLSSVPDQQGEQEEADDAKRFVELLASALASGRAILQGVKDRQPPSMQSCCGWAKADHLTPGWYAPERAQVIGWFDGLRVYLDENEAFAMASGMSSKQNKKLLAPDTLRHRLLEKGWLIPEEGVKRRYHQRKTIQGKRLKVLAFDWRTFWPDDESAVVEEDA